MLAPETACSRPSTWSTRASPVHGTSGGFSKAGIDPTCPAATSGCSSDSTEPPLAKHLWRHATGELRRILWLSSGIESAARSSSTPGSTPLTLSTRPVTKVTVSTGDDLDRAQTPSAAPYHQPAPVQQVAVR